MSNRDSHVRAAWWALRIGLGVGPILAGLDKFFNILTDWTMYLSPLATKITHLSAPTFMHIVGVIEIVAGAFVLTRYVRPASFVVMCWLLAIAVNLLITGMFYDLAVRDVEIAVGAFALFQLSSAPEKPGAVAA